MKTKTKIISIISLIALGVGGYFAYPHVVVKVPSAIGEAQQDNDAAQLCKPFIDEGIPCEVKWKPSEDYKRGALISQSRAAGSLGVKFIKNDTIKLIYSQGTAEAVFPDVEGKDVEEVQKELFELGIIVKSKEIEDSTEFKKNQVISANIPKGTKVESGTEVTLVVSSGASEIPDFVGMSKKEATDLAKKNKITLKFIDEESDEKEGTVLSQSLTAGEPSSELKNKNTIELTIAGKQKVSEIDMIDVIGMSAEEAQQKLVEGGFKNVVVVSVKNNEVSEKQVTQTVPTPSEKTTTDERIVVIVSEPIS